MNPGRLGVGIVGGAACGCVIAQALAGAGHALVGVHPRTAEDAERAEALLPALPTLSLADLIERSELVLIDVAEDELPTLVADLAERGAWQVGQLVVHTQPGVGTEVLRPAAERGAIALALHPAIAFTGTSLDIAALRDAACAVSAPGPVLPIAQALALEMGTVPVVIEEGDRPAYAAALQSATAGLDAQVAQAADALAELGVDEPARVLGPVTRSALDRALGRHEHRDPDDERG